jgi:hypothetical protein
MRGQNSMTALWHGTLRENVDLMRAVARNCACGFGLMGTRLTSCAAHLMLFEDQRALDGLLFGRRIAARLRDEEWLTTRTPTIARAR